MEGLICIHTESGAGTPEPLHVRPTLTAQELSRLIPLHPVTILRWARERKIPHRRLSARKIVFLPDEINAWLASGSNLYPVNVSCVASTHEREAA